MSNESVAHSVTNETKGAFESILKAALSSKSNELNHIDNVNCNNGDIKSLTHNGDNLSLQSEADKSNKSYLLNKFLDSSKEERKAKDLPATVSLPIPKPRKSKSNIKNSTSSQKTYTVEYDRANNIETVVDVVVDNSPKLSTISKSTVLHSSKDENKTYVKNEEHATDSSKLVNANRLDNKVCSDKSTDTKITQESKNTKTDKTYNYDKIVEIVIHKTDALLLNSYVTHPTVKVHVVDINTGKYLPKSSKTRSVVFYYENEEQDYILPVMTSPYNLQEKRTFVPEWEESILLNEDFSYLTNENTIMFFEVLDYVPALSKKFQKLQKNCYKGWHRVTFGFLKPIGKEQLNINKKIKLQLYYPNEIKKQCHDKCDLWHIWKTHKLKRYPSALYVTVKEIISPTKVIETFRSKTPLQKEHISNIKNYKRNLQKSIVAPDEIMTASEFKGAKNFKLPNKPFAGLNSYENGCFLLQFSNNGLYLAAAVQLKGTFTVIVYSVNTFEEVQCVNEHQGLIYSISWSLDDTLLITASADNTVMIWNFDTQSFAQILPHPTYVYASQVSKDNAIIATGCYDTVVRIWFYSNKEGKYELHQEMEKHEGFVTSLCFNNKSNHLYTSDSHGKIFEWSRLDNFDWQFERDISTPDLRNTVINEILLFPNWKKMLVHSRDSILRIISVKRACVLHWLKGALNNGIQTFCSVTTCGNYVTCGSENGLVVVWDTKTGKDISTYNPFSGELFLETVHCAKFHPKDNYIAFSHYGNVSPILLYYYSETKKEIKQNRLTQYVFYENEKNEEKEIECENINFRDILKKMDSMLQ